MQIISLLDSGFILSYLSALKSSKQRYFYVVIITLFNKGEKANENLYIFVELLKVHNFVKFLLAKYFSGNIGSRETQVIDIYFKCDCCLFVIIVTDMYLFIVSNLLDLPAVE